MSNLRSGMYGNGGRATANGHHTGQVRGTRRVHRDRPYRVSAVVASTYSRTVAHNSTTLYREER